MCQTRKSVLQLNIQTLDDALLHFDGLLLEICLIDANKKLIFLQTKHRSGRVEFKDLIFQAEMKSLSWGGVADGRCD